MGAQSPRMKMLLYPLHQLRAFIQCSEEHGCDSQWKSYYEQIQRQFCGGGFKTLGTSAEAHNLYLKHDQHWFYDEIDPVRSGRSRRQKHVHLDVCVSMCAS